MPTTWRHLIDFSTPLRFGRNDKLTTKNTKKWNRKWFVFGCPKMNIRNITTEAQRTQRIINHEEHKAHEGIIISGLISLGSLLRSRLKVNAEGRKNTLSVYIRVYLWLNTNNRNIETFCRLGQFILFNQ